MRFLITGAAGFIGAALAKKFIHNNEIVYGIDNLNSYYDVNLKLDRIKNINLSAKKNVSLWKFEKCDLNDINKLSNIFSNFKPDVVINLAAQAGVRYSIENPKSYIMSNLLGFGNILEECRKNKVKNLIYASSSSVYGGNRSLPFSEEQQVNHPVSLYAATKKSNELMAHSYSHVYGIPSTGLRFFTVYGPWGRPDMAPMIFTKSIIEGNKIDVFNFGKMIRDFTYIEDVVEAIYLCSYKYATRENDFNFFNTDASTSFAPYRIFNVGNSEPIEILNFIELLEKYTEKKALLNFVDKLPVDVVATESNTSRLKNWINFSPKTNIEEGVKTFIKWYKNYYES